VNCSGTETAFDALIVINALALERNRRDLTVTGQRRRSRSSPKRIRVRPLNQSGCIFHAPESRSGRNDPSFDHPQLTSPRASRPGSKMRSEIGQVKPFDYQLAAGETLQNSQPFGRAPLTGTKNPYRHNSAKNAKSIRPVTSDHKPRHQPSTSPRH